MSNLSESDWSDNEFENDSLEKLDSFSDCPYIRLSDDDTPFSINSHTYLFDEQSEEINEPKEEIMSEEVDDFNEKPFINCFRYIPIPDEPPFDPVKLKKLTTTCGFDGNFYSVLQKRGENVWVKLDMGESTDIISNGAYYERIYKEFQKMPNILKRDQCTSEILRHFMTLGALLNYEKTASLDGLPDTNQFSYFNYLFDHNRKTNIDLETIKMRLVTNQINYLWNTFPDVQPLKHIDTIDQGKIYYEDMMEQIEAGKMKNHISHDGRILSKEIAHMLKVMYGREEDLTIYLESSIRLMNKSNTPVTFPLMMLYIDFYNEDETFSSLIKQENYTKAYGYFLFCLYATGRIKNLNFLINL